VDIWTIDVERGVHQPVTSDAGMERWAVWSPDGDRLVYVAKGKVFVMPSRGGPSQVLVDEGTGLLPTDWSADGKYVLFQQSGAGTAADVWLLPMEGDHKPVPLVQTEYGESQAHSSHDGRWISYTSNATGRPEIYVRAFDPNNIRPAERGLQVSTNGGVLSRWRRDGRELFFEAPDESVMAVDLDLTTFPNVRPGIPRQVLPLPSGTLWDVTGDGQRFLVALPPAEAGLTPINVLLNWSPVQQK
jgi:serine/threonine-protein kinase